MRRHAFLAAFFALATASEAVTVTLDSPFTVARPESGTKSVDITGTLTTGAAVSSASLIYSPATLSATERILGANINGEILGGLASGSYTGVLFTLEIDAMTAIGAYMGAAQFKVKVGRATLSSNVEPFWITVTEFVPPPPVPEPGPLVALGVGVLGLVRRRRRQG